VFPGRVGGTRAKHETEAKKFVMHHFEPVIVGEEEEDIGLSDFSEGALRESGPCEERLFNQERETVIESPTSSPS